MNQALLSRLFLISRPKFWLYLAGTFLVGYAAGAPSLNTFTTPSFFIGLLYFTLPANLFLYGVNDYFDRDTDAHNDRKGAEEAKVRSDETQVLRTLLLVITLITVLYGFFLPVKASISLTTFFLLSYTYSGPPTRLKATPVLDSASNILYVFPGLVGFTLATSQWPSIFIIAGAALWTAAMHLYSAIPDIEADKSADIRTSAVVLGETYSLIACTVLWTASAGLFISIDQWLAPSLVYPLISVSALFHGHVKAQYRVYPYINGLIGMAAFWYAALPLL